MNVNRIKIHGAISEMRSARSNVQHLLAEAYTGEIESIKQTVSTKVDAMFEGIENYLQILMSADLAKDRHRQND